MIKLLLIAHLNDLSGANKSLVDLSIGIKKIFNLTVCIPRKGALSDELDRLGINYVVVPSAAWVYKRDERALKKVVKHIINFFGEIRYYYYFKKYKPDIIHFNSSIYGCGSKAAYRLGIPYSWHIRELPEENFNLTFFNKHKSIDAISKSKSIITISMFMKSKLENVFEKNRIKVVYNGVQSIHSPTTTIFEDEYEIKALVLIGAIAEDKGQIDAIKAIRHLANNGYRIPLQIVGGITDRRYYEQLKTEITDEIRDLITFTGHQSDVEKYRKTKNIALICSKAEAFGRVTIEAMSYGQLIIGADSGATPEIVKDGINGFLYKQGDYIDLANKILEAYNCDCKKEISQNAIQTVQNSFLIEKTICKVVDVFNQIIQIEGKA